MSNLAEQPDLPRSETAAADPTQNVRVSVPPAPMPAAEAPIKRDRRRSLPIDIDRRTRIRCTYPYRQRIAEVDGDGLPGRDRFREIQCNDIAAGGFSFLCSQLPTSTTLVVELGTPPQASYLMAEVAHSTRFQRDGERVYMVGCRYTGRVVYPDD